MIEKEVYGEEAMEQFGADMASAFANGGVVFLDGNLGMGKTTLVRGLLRGMGYVGPVKSPTYTIVEPYEMNGVEAFHFDLYRIAEPEELEYMGIRDYFREGALCLVEWAEMGKGVLPEADLVIHLDFVRQGRKVSIAATSAKGETILQRFATHAAA